MCLTGTCNGTERAAFSSLVVHVIKSQLNDFKSDFKSPPTV